jgi:hypothetical protein
MITQMRKPLLWNKLRLPAEQKGQVVKLQKEVDGRLDHSLKAKQKADFSKVLKALGSGGPGAGGVGQGDPLFFRTTAVAVGAVFRASRYPPSFPGLTGRDLTAGKNLAEAGAKGAPAR